MKYDDFKRMAAAPVRRPRRDIEHRIQASFVRWFRAVHPQLASLLIAVPNAAKRSARMGAYMKEEGMVPGAADLLLLVSRHGYGSLAIETKTQKGRQQDTQKEWQQAFCQAGNKYVICRSLEEFVNVVNEYLK